MPVLLIPVAVQAAVSAVPPVPAPEPDRDIVVVARRRCDLAVAGRALGRAALDRYAAAWRAGRPVEIVVPASLRTRCLAKVMFRLHDRGVTRATFIDAGG